MSEGWICLHRGWRDNPLFKGEFSRADAWVWLIENACWKPTTFDIKGKRVTLDRGQLCASRDYLAQVWGWSPSGVERFLTRLQTEQMIGRETGQGKSVLTICNYAKYQDVDWQTGQENGQRAGQETGQQKNKETNKQDYSEAKASGASAPVSVTAVDVTKSIFDTGVMILKASGKNDRQARSIIGRWRQAYSDSIVLTVLSRCQVEQPSEPVGWVTKALQAEGRCSAGRQNGHARPHSESTGDLINRMALAAGGDQELRT